MDTGLADPPNISEGFSASKIASVLQDDYGLYKTASFETIKRAVQDKISDILGGSYQAQEELLKPIIEYLVEKGLNRYDIYMAFKNAEFSKYGWFLDWSYSKAFIEADINQICKRFNLDPSSSWDAIKPYLHKMERYYAGISEQQWLEWIFEGKRIEKLWRNPTGDSVEEEYSIGSTKLKRIKEILCKRHGVDDINQLRFKLHRERVIEY